MKEEQTTRPWAVAVRMLLVIAVMASFVLASTAQAAQHDTEGRRVIPMGRTVGIKLFSDGVMVVGFSEVSAAGGSSAPARECGLREGDIITHINSAEVDTIEEVQSVLQQVGGEKMSIRASRDGKQLQVTAQAVQCSADGQYKLGAWIRDSMAGIGTMTYYDPGTGVFGALGHGINDVDTALLMPLQSGNIMYSEVTDVKKGESGAPGELHGARVYVRHHRVLRAADFRGIDAHRPRAAAQIEHAPARLRRIQLQHRPRAAIQPARRKQSLRLRKNDGNASNGLDNHGFLLYTYVLKTAAPPAEAGSVGGGREGNAAQTAVAKPFKRFSVVSLSA